MSQYYTLVTDVGLAKLANAASLNQKVAITTVAVGDGGGNPVTPSSSMTSLVNQVWSGPVTRYETDPNNPTQLVIEGYIPADVGGWTIREVGVFDADGDLIAIGNYDDTNKPAIGGGLVRDLLLRTVIELGNYAGQVMIEIDPAIVLASRRWVDEELGKHNSAPAAHPDKATKIDLAIAVPAGAILTFAGATPPTGFLECDGSEVSRTDYADLFAAIGTIYGEGDGSTTFNIPDLRGEFLRGYDDGRGIDANRAIGSFQDHGIPQIRGGVNSSYNSVYGAFNDIGGSFSGIPGGNDHGTDSGSGGKGFIFDTAGTIPVADTVRPRNIAVMYCIRY